MTQVHQWFVARGRIGVSSLGAEVHVELDPEGSAYCVLSARDASEIADIITQHARSIWGLLPEADVRPAQVSWDSNASCLLVAESGVLVVTAHDSKPFVAVDHEANAVCRMNVTQAIALVQVLQKMAASVDRPPA